MEVTNEECLLITLFYYDVSPLIYWPEIIFFCFLGCGEPFQTEVFLLVPSVELEG